MDPLFYLTKKQVQYAEYLGLQGYFHETWGKILKNWGPLKVNFTNLPNPMNPVVILVVTEES